MTLGKDLDDQITALYLAGLSMSQIGRRVGLDRHRVRHSLRRTNTPTRSIGEAKRLAVSLGCIGPVSNWPVRFSAIQNGSINS